MVTFHVSFGHRAIAMSSRELRAAVLPAIYAQKAKVTRAFELLARVRRVSVGSRRPPREHNRCATAHGGRLGADGPFTLEAPGLLALAPPPAVLDPAAQPLLRLPE